MIESKHQQIQSIVATAVDTTDLYRRLATAFVAESNAAIGLAWACDGDSITPICQVLQDPDSSVSLPFSSQKHTELLLKARQSGQAILVTPPGDSTSVSAILISPVRRAGETELLEFVLPAENSRETNQQILQLLADYSRIAQAFDGEPIRKESPESAVVAIGGAPPATATPFLQGDLNEYAHHIHQSLDYHETASRIANETRRALDCDRVTVFRRGGRSFVAQAVSGQPSINRRSNTIRALESFANAVLKTGRPFWYPNEDPVPPQIETPLKEYVTLSLTRSLAVIPVFDREESTEGTPNQKPTQPRVIAGIVLEQASQRWDRPAIQPLIEIASQHSSIALRNAEHVRSIFLFPLWSAIGHTKTIGVLRNVPRLILAVVALLAVVCTLAFVQADFDVACEGSLMPAQRRRIFAEQDGIVKAIHVKHGSVMAKHDVLLELENDELLIDRERLLGERDALRQRLEGNRSQRIHSPTQSNEVTPGASQKEIEAEIASLDKQLEAVTKKIAGLTVSTPTAGEVLTWDVENRLRDRPVQQGDLLVEVADTQDEWQLLLDLPDRKVGHLLRAVAEHGEQPLAVAFALAAEPGKEFSATLREVAASTSINADRLHTVRLVADIRDEDLVPFQRAGTTVSAKIACGRRSLGYVWLHEAWEFIQYRVLFRVR